MKTKIRKYQVWTYDVWGNKNDGYDVNNRFKENIIEIKCKEKVYNEGTLHQFSTFEPTDRQLNRALGISCNATWNGESDYSLYCERTRDAYPICELEYIVD